MKKQSSDDPSKFTYVENEDDIVIITYGMGGNYDFHVYQKKSDALTDLYNAWVTHHCVIFCSDDEIMKEHEKEIEDAPPRYGDDIPAVDEEELSHANT
jgi:hypothetical protein